jgi:hypothetical protein
MQEILCIGIQSTRDLTLAAIKFVIFPLKIALLIHAFILH